MDSPRHWMTTTINKVTKNFCQRFMTDLEKIVDVNWTSWHATLPAWGSRVFIYSILVICSNSGIELTWRSCNHLLVSWENKLNQKQSCVERDYSTWPINSSAIPPARTWARLLWWSIHGTGPTTAHPIGTSRPRSLDDEERQSTIDKRGTSLNSVKHERRTWHKTPYIGPTHSNRLQTLAKHMRSWIILYQSILAIERERALLFSQLNCEGAK